MPTPPLSSETANNPDGSSSEMWTTPLRPESASVAPTHAIDTPEGVPSGILPVYLHSPDAIGGKNSVSKNTEERGRTQVESTNKKKTFQQERLASKGRFISLTQATM